MKEQFGNIVLKSAAAALQKNGFDVSIHQTGQEAAKFVVEELIPRLQANLICRGDSHTVTASGLPALLAQSGLKIIDHNDPTASDEEWIERHRETLLVDLFIASANGITSDGQVVNLDAIGNRLAAIVYGPKNVVLLAGRNKISPTLEDARQRIKNTAAPTNALRLNRKTPCAATGRCANCQSPDRICSVWSIIEKCCPTGRIHIALINEELGF